MPWCAPKRGASRLFFVFGGGWSHFSELCSQLGDDRVFDCHVGGQGRDLVGEVLDYLLDVYLGLLFCHGDEYSRFTLTPTPLSVRGHL